jgi:HlyD family secretion protein
MAENSTRNKIFWIVGAIAAFIVIAVVLLRRQPATVSIALVAREDLSANITSNGKVEPISPQVARAEFPTFVDKIQAAEGQAVRPGQLILTLDAADIRAQLAQAHADLLAAQTDLKNSRAGGPPDEVAQLQQDLQAAKIEVDSLDRTGKSLTKLVAQQAATQDELAQNQASLAKARANLEALEAKKQDLARRATVGTETATLRASQSQELVDSLEEKVRSATVVSSLDGTLYSLPVHVNDYVKVGDTLAELADLSHVRVRAFVDEPDIGALEVGQQVEVTWDARADRLWTGRVEQVPKQVVARGMRSVGEVLCSVDNDKLELLPNINVQVRILVRARQGVLVAPREAVHEEQGKHYVFVVAGDKLHQRQVSVGISSASKYEIVSGLSEGERVALPGDHAQRDGMAVRIEEAE